MTGIAAVVTKIDRHIGNRLSLLRQRRGWSMATFARLIDMPEEHLSAMEHGELRISSALLFACASQLDVPLNYFFSGPYNFTFEEIVDDLRRGHDAVLRGMDD